MILTTPFMFLLAVNAMLLPLTAGQDDDDNDDDASNRPQIDDPNAVNRRFRKATCQLDNHQLGVCMDKERCPSDPDPFLAAFPIYCDHGGVCCHGENGPVKPQVIGNLCQFNVTDTGVCTDIGGCPSQEHLYYIDNYVFCDRSNAVVCCPEMEIGGNSTNSTTNPVPLEAREGDFCTLPNGTLGVCVMGASCDRKGYVNSTDWNYCDRSGNTICCQPRGEYQTTTTTQAPSNMFKEGDRCYIQQETGICMGASNCANAIGLGSQPLTSPQYCGLTSSLVCCPAKDIHIVDPVPVPGPSTGTSSITSSVTSVGLSREKQVGDDCKLANRANGKCTNAVSCIGDKYKPNKYKVTYCDSGHRLLCCPKEETAGKIEVTTEDYGGVLPPRVNFDCGDSYDWFPSYTPSEERRLDRIQHGGKYYDRKDDRRTMGSSHVKFMALIGMGDGNIITWFCNGALLNERWVLAAAHCFLLTESGTGRLEKFPSWTDPIWSSVVVRLGEFDFSLKTDWASPEDVDVAEVVPYPDYIPDKGYHDLVLLKLSRNVQFGRYVNPVCLPWEGRSFTVSETEPVTQMGWGAFWKEGASNIPFMSKVDLRLKSYLTCQDIYSKKESFRYMFPQSLGDDTLCVSNPDVDVKVCQGRFGGTLVYLDSRYRYVLLGIEFMSYGCLFQDDPGLFVNLRKKPYLKWIKNVAFGYSQPFTVL